MGHAESIDCIADICMNARFLGLPELVSMHQAGRHESERIVPPHHQLNETIRRELTEFFQPFNRLLVEFIQDVYGGR